MFLEGKLTYSGLAIAAVSYLLDKYDVTVIGYDEPTVAGVLVGLVIAVIGRARRG